MTRARFDTLAAARHRSHALEIRERAAVNLEEVYGTPVLIGRFPGVNRLTINAVPDWVEDDIRQGRANERVDNRRR